MHQSRMKSLQAKHASLEARIHEEANRPYRNDMLIQMLKKQKLQLREQITVSLKAA